MAEARKRVSSLGQLREVLAEADPDRVVFGSDWPFYHPVLPLMKLLVATEGRPALAGAPGQRIRRGQSA